VYPLGLPEKLNPLILSCSVKGFFSAFSPDPVPFKGIGHARSKNSRRGRVGSIGENKAIIQWTAHGTRPFKYRVLKTNQISKQAQLSPPSPWTSPLLSLSRRSPWRRSLPSATVATPFGRSRLAARLSASLRAVSVRLGLDFAQYLCHSLGQHHLAAGPCPAYSKAAALDRS
jgi:hypothetical protein